MDDEDDEDSSVGSGDEVDDDDDVPLGIKGRGRRGSEGYEVRPVSREQMLRQYLESVGENYDRYIRYIPEPESESETEPEIQAGLTAVPVDSVQS